MRKIAFVALVLVLITPFALNAFAQVEMQPMEIQILYAQSFQVSAAQNTNPSLFLKDVNLDRRQSNSIPKNKMSNGALNMATSWVDIPYHVADTSAKTNPVVGVVIGAPLGVVSGVQQFASGAVDVATYPADPESQSTDMSPYKMERVENGAKVKIFEW